MPTSRLLGALLCFGAVGLIADLLLDGHYDDPWQFAPLVLLVAALVVTAAALRRAPGRRGRRVLRVVMASCVAAGAVGVWLHYDGNTEFERERDPAIGGLALFREAVTGATPVLAPGALAQLGLLGLLFASTLPARDATDDSTHPGDPA